MVDVELYLVSRIAKRSISLRKTYGLSMEKLSDKASVSRIEKKGMPESKNFITETVLSDYVNSFNITKEEIIFGKANEIEELLEWLFFNFFMLIRFRDLTIDSELYSDIDNLDIETQKKVLSLAASFAEFNIQRYKFLKTEELFMDTLNRESDKQLIINGKMVNIERDFRSDPINEETVIDFIDMNEKLWLMCKQKCITSFKEKVIKNIFVNFKYSNINMEVKKWVSCELNNIIIPDVIDKMKSNGVFKIGFMVKNLITDFLDEKLVTTTETTIPVETIQNERRSVSICNFNISELSEEEMKEREEIVLRISEEMMKGEIPDNIPESKLRRYGISFGNREESIKSKNVDIDVLLDRASREKRNRIITNNRMRIEEGPIVHSSNFNTYEEMTEYFEDWFNDQNFKNQNIPGYLTVNSQIALRLQERMNNEILESIHNFVNIQINLLCLLNEEELLRFAK